MIVLFRRMVVIMTIAQRVYNPWAHGFCLDNVKSRSTSFLPQPQPNHNSVAGATTDYTTTPPPTPLLPLLSRALGGTTFLTLRGGNVSDGERGDHNNNTKEDEEEESLLADLAQNIKDFYALFDGSECDEQSEKLLYAAYDKVFSQDLTVLSYPPKTTTVDDLMDASQRVELGFDDLYQQVVSVYAKNRIPVEKVTIEIRPKETTNNDEATTTKTRTLEYYVYAEQMGHKAILRVHAKVQGGKIIFCERQATTFVAMEKYKMLATLFDGSGLFDREACYQAFVQTMDPSVTMTSLRNNGELVVELSFDEMWQAWWKQAQQGPSKLLDVQPLPDGKFTYALQIDSHLGGGDKTTMNNKSIILRCQALTNKEGKIVRIEREETNACY